jgi:hypothetical protein
MELISNLATGSSLISIKDISNLIRDIIMKKYIFYLIAIFFVLNSFFQAQQFHGVFAGVNYYPNPLNDLSDCVNETISVKSHFVTYKNWPPEIVHCSQILLLVRLEL